MSHCHGDLVTQGPTDTSAHPTPSPGSKDLQAREAYTREFPPRIAGMIDRQSDARPTDPAQIAGPAAEAPISDMPPPDDDSNITPPHLPPTASFCPVNAPSPSKSAGKMKSAKKAKTQPPSRSLAPLAPAPPRSLQSLAAGGQLGYSGKNLYDIPAEIRVEIYKLVLENVTVHILPRESQQERRAPHPLTRTSRVVRNEVLPIIHSTCAIKATITDFNFSPLLDFMARIPPQDEKALTKNTRLKIQLCTTHDKSRGSNQSINDGGSLRKWLTYRADPHRLQPHWEYCGAWPGRRVETEIRRRISRMREAGKREEMVAVAKGMKLERIEAPPKS